MQAHAIDHIGIVGPNLDQLTRNFSRLGFTVAPRCELISVGPDGQSSPMGQSNCHLIFDNAYVELTAVEGDITGHHLADEIARYFGLHILVLLSENAESDRESLVRRGITAGAVAGAGRDIRYPGKSGAARFRWFRVPHEEAPDAFVCFVEHLNRELVFDPALNSHANGARSFHGVRICVADPAESADRLAHIFGCEAEQSHGEPVFRLPVGEIALHSRDFLMNEFPGLEPPPLPWVAGFSVVVADLTDCRRVLTDAGVNFTDSDQRIWVAPSESGGTLVEFVPHPSRTSIQRMVGT